MSLHFFNGFQFNPEKGKSGGYESDGGLRILHPTDEFLIVFDFRDLDYEKLLAARPVLKVRRKQGETPQLVESRYSEGVVYSQPIRDLRRRRARFVRPSDVPSEDPDFVCAPLRTEVRDPSPAVDQGRRQPDSSRGRGPLRPRHGTDGRRAQKGMT